MCDTVIIYSVSLLSAWTKDARRASMAHIVSHVVWGGECILQLCGNLINSSSVWSFPKVKKLPGIFSLLSIEAQSMLKLMEIML